MGQICLLQSQNHSFLRRCVHSQVSISKYGCLHYSRIRGKSRATVCCIIMRYGGHFIRNPESGSEYLHARRGPSHHRRSSYVLEIHRRRYPYGRRPCFTIYERANAQGSFPRIRKESEEACQSRCCQLGSVYRYGFIILAYVPGFARSHCCIEYGQCQSLSHQFYGGVDPRSCEDRGSVVHYAHCGNQNRRDELEISMRRWYVSTSMLKELHGPKRSDLVRFVRLLIVLPRTLTLRNKYSRWTKLHWATADNQLVSIIIYSRTR